MNAEASEPVPLRRNRDFQLLWGGQAISVMGSQISKIAYPMLVLAMTGSPAKAGIAGFAAMLGYLLFPLPAGALADRFDRKRMMIACDAIRLGAVGSVAIAGLVAHISFTQVLIAGFVEGSASVFFGLAQRAALPMIVHTSQRAVAVSQNEARNFGAQLAGPALGGSLFELSWAAPFAADALTYVASLVTLPFIKTPMRAGAGAGAGAAGGGAAGGGAARGGAARGGAAGGGAAGGGAAADGHWRRALIADLREGLAWTWREPFLRYSAFFAGAVNVLLQVVTLGLIVLARRDGASLPETGFIVACYGAGGLAGAFAAPWIQHRLPAGLTITGCMWVWAILLGAMAAIRAPLWLCPVVIVMGFVGPAWNVSAQTYRMRITPNEMLGRTSSVALQIAWGTIPLGSLIAGFLLQGVGPSRAIAVVAAGMGVVALAASATGSIRRAGRGPASGAASGAPSGAPGGAATAGALSRQPRVLRSATRNPLSHAYYAQPRVIRLASAEGAREGREVEQAQCRVTPAVTGRPVIEMTQALVRGVQDRAQYLRVARRLLAFTVQDHRRSPGDRQAQQSGQQQPLQVLVHSRPPPSCRHLGYMVRHPSDILLMGGSLPGDMRAGSQRARRSSHRRRGAAHRSSRKLFVLRKLSALRI